MGKRKRKGEGKVNKRTLEMVRRPPSNEFRFQVVEKKGKRTRFYEPDHKQYEIDLARILRKRRSQRRRMGRVPKLQRLILDKYQKEICPKLKEMGLDVKKMKLPLGKRKDKPKGKVGLPPGFLPFAETFD